MAKKNINIILDVSGSMQNCLPTALQQLSDTLTELRQTLHVESTVTFTTFSNSVKLHYTNIKLEEATIPNDIYALGSTALWDAILLNIDSIESQPESYYFIIVSDGLDNASRHVVKAKEELEKFKTAGGHVILLCTSELASGEYNNIADVRDNLHTFDPNFPASLLHLSRTLSEAISNN